MDNDVITFIIDNYTNEAGVRKLKEVLFEIVSEINLQMLKETKKYDNLVSNVKKIMESVHLKYKDFSVPLTVDFGAGDHWGQAH